MSDEMKKVKGPDGKVYKFPADMDMGRIDEIMREQYPSQSKSLDTQGGGVDNQQAKNIMIAKQTLPVGIGQAMSLMPEKAQSIIASGQQGIS